MGIRGSLREASLADVSQLLALGMKTGCLSVTDGSRFGQIFFDRGRITYAHVVNRRDRLGDIMVHDGVLAREQLDEVLEEQARSPERRLGELLVERQLVGRETLLRYIRMQIEEAVFHLFTWSRGSFFFEPDAPPENADILVSIHPESLLLEAARRVDEWGLIEKKIPSLDLIFEVDEERLRSSDVTLTAEQQTLIPLLDGSRTVQEIVDRTGLLEFDAAKALYGLVQAGFAHRVGRRSAHGGRPHDDEIVERRNLGAAFYRTGMLEDAAHEYERILELDPADRAARFRLGVIAAAGGRNREAIRRFRAVLEDGGAQYAAFVNLAHVLRAAGRHADALLVLDEAEALRPRTPSVALARAIALLESGDVTRAGDSFGEYRRRLPHGVPPAAMYFHYAALAMAAGRDVEGAQELVDEGLAHHPNSAPLLLLRGLMALHGGHLDDAERWVTRAIEEDGTLPQAYRALGDIAFQRSAHEDALRCYLRAVDFDPALSDEVHARIGMILYRERQYDAAVRHLQRAIELNPSNQLARSHIEIVAHAGG
jgi:tetratricopeptide (TPR) repeat protein